MADVEEPTTAPSVRSPSDFLNSIRGKTVLVKLNSGVDYKGNTFRGI